MAKILIIDDDVKYAEMFKKRLRGYFNADVEIMSDIDIEYLDSILIDLIFLDIEMGTVNGIDLAKELNKRKDAPKIIFLSNRNSLVHDSMEVQPFYFIRKSDLDTDLHNAISLLKAAKFGIRELVRVQKDIIDVGNVVYIECENHYLTFHFKSGARKVYRATMREVRQMLEPYLCVQVHKSYIVNLRYVEVWKAVHIILRGNVGIDVGRRYQVSAKKAYQEAKINGFI